MSTLRKIQCGFCGETITTTDARKMYCSKQHADRARNLGRRIFDDGRIEDLRDFSKLNPEQKARVLLGEADFTICMYDIEATHLDANVGRIICASFKPIGGETYTFDGHERRFKDRDVWNDSALAAAIRDELEKYDIIVGWNSRAFDTKFINARNARAGGRTKRAQYQVDGMWAWRTKMRAWSSLKSVQQFLGTETEKTSIEWGQWMRAFGWDKRLRIEAMNEIVDHCERDVMALEEVYRAVVAADAVRGLRKDGGIL